MIATKSSASKRERTHAEVHHRAHRPVWLRRLAWTVLTILLVCVLLDFIASPIAKSVVNSRLDKMPGFTGHVDRVKVSLWRGKAEADGFTMQKRDPGAEPFVHVKTASMNFSYLRLFAGKLSASVFIDQLAVTMIKTEPTPKKDPKAPPEPLKTEAWRESLQKTIPMELNRVEVRNSHVMFVDRTHQPEAQIGILQFHVLATDLRTKPKAGTDLPAQIVMEGTTSGNGHLMLRVQAAPLSEVPRFHLQFALTNLDLPSINNFLLAFAKIDVARGTFEFESEVTAEGGAYKGYVKPFFKDLDFKTASDAEKTPMQLLKKKAVAAVTQVFKNKQENKVATKAPISGNFEKNKVDVWTTISNLMHNAFVQAIREGFEGQTPTKH